MKMALFLLLGLFAAQPNGGRSAAYSPDGRSIAFLSSTPHTPADLWVMHADGTQKRRLTTRGVSRFEWSRDGRSIVFVARRKGYEEVMSIPADGQGGGKRVAGLPPNASIPVTSPDGRLFAFTAPNDHDVRDLWIGTADGTRIEAVTEKINVRSVFFSPDSKKIYYEAGRTYGVGIWEIDLSHMESKPLLNKYIGTPAYSAKAGLVAYPYPTDPGQFEVHTMPLDGSPLDGSSKEAIHKAPKLAERWITWDAAAQGVYYLGREQAQDQDQDQDTGKEATGQQESKKAKAKAKTKAKAKAKAKAKRPTEKSAPHATNASAAVRVGAAAVWRLDFATGAQQRISPAELHVVDFSVAPDGNSLVLTGVLETSRMTEIFHLDLAAGKLTPLASARASTWMPVASPDATRIAFFANTDNEGRLDALKVASFAGDELATYSGLVLEADTRVFWLPQGDGLVLFSGRGLHAFTPKGAFDFPNKDDLRAYLYADVSIQENKILVSAIPRYGETPGLYQLEAVDNTLRLTDFRFPSAPEEEAPNVYLQPRWSLDGTRIAFTDGVDVWTMTSAGKGRARLTHHAENNAKGDATPVLASYPTWSVNGNRVGYTLTVYDGTQVRRELWIMTADGNDAKRLFAEELDSQFQVFQPEYTYPPFFDADVTDEHIVLTALREGVPNIFTVHVASGETRALTETGAVFPALLPEEGVIVYTSLEGNDEQLWVMNTDGTQKRPFVLKQICEPERAEQRSGERVERNVAGL